jgi:hypothetical protein
MIRSLAFLEFYFFYAYNDYHEYGTFFANEHEGDVEGCCLVFERESLESEVGDPDTLLSVQPVALITSVHAENQGLDRVKFLGPALNPEEPELSPEELEEKLRLWVAVGSHATYFDAGTHDIQGFLDTTGLILDEAPWVPLVASAFPGWAWQFALALLELAEFFSDSEDTTSDDGIITRRPGAIDGSDPRKFDPPQILVTPLSRATDVTVGPGGTLLDATFPIYSEAERPALRVRAYAGYWGAHDPDEGLLYGKINHSSTFENKTGRYFRRLMPSLPPPTID